MAPENKVEAQTTDDYLHSNAEVAGLRSRVDELLRSNNAFEQRARDAERLLISVRFTNGMLEEVHSEFIASAEEVVGVSGGPGTTLAERAALLREHALVCPKHPMRDVERQVAALRAQLERMSKTPLRLDGTSDSAFIDMADDVGAVLADTKAIADRYVDGADVEAVLDRALAVASEVGQHTMELDEPLTKIAIEYGLHWPAEECEGEDCRRCPEIALAKARR